MSRADPLSDPFVTLSDPFVTGVEDKGGLGDSRIWLLCSVSISGATGAIPYSVDLRFTKKTNIYYILFFYYLHSYILFSGGF